MNDSKKAGGICGFVVTNGDGRIVTSAGRGNDPRVKTLVTDEVWVREAAQRRMMPLRFNDAGLVALTVDLDDGKIFLFSDVPTDTVLSFLISVDFAYDILHHVLTDPYDAMAIVGKDENLAFISPVHEKFFGFKDGEAAGQPVSAVIENSRLPEVVRSGVAEVGQIHKMKGRERVVSRHPILHEGEIVGAIGRIMFKGPQQVEALAKRINILEKEIATYKQESQRSGRGEEYLDAIIGQSLAVQSVRQQIRKIAPLDIPVLIQGESGTGKELVARALHMMSSRQDARLVTVNAAALPETLVESELFGYEAGSFTGADKKGRAGKFELADKGTMFLDEIGDMQLDVQTKLLRVLQDRIVERIGGDKPKMVDFRLCSATNHDLEQLVDQGKFRLDLYYRISPVSITLPPLRERVEDIPMLVAHFVENFSRQYGKPVPEVDMEVHEFLMEQQWPGNIRQLQHEIEKVFVFCESGRLSVDDFRKNAASGGERVPVQTAGGFEAIRTGGNLKESLENLENQLINDALIRYKGNKKKVAEQLGISRSYLYKKLEELS